MESQLPIGRSESLDESATAWAELAQLSYFQCLPSTEGGSPREDRSGVRGPEADVAHRQPCWGLWASPPTT